MVHTSRMREIEKSNTEIKPLVAAIFKKFNIQIFFYFFYLQGKYFVSNITPVCITPPS